LRKEVEHPVMREQLIRAVLNTYGDAAFHVGIGVEPDCNFFAGLKCNSYAHYSRDQLLEAIQLSPLLSFPPMPDTLDKLVINEKLYLYKPSVNDAQVYTAPENADKYVHCVCRYNPHYDIYYLFDHERKRITFALGELQMEVPLVEYSGWAWKATRKYVKCVSSENLEQSFRDDFWNPIAVRIGRYVLGIKPVI